MARADTKNITKPTSPNDCPIIPLMERINGLAQANHELDVDFECRQTEINDAACDLWIARRTLIDMMALTRATSLQGALGQLCMLYEFVGDIVDAIPTVADQNAVRPLHVAVNRLAYSIGGVLTTAIDGDDSKPVDEIVKQVMPANHDAMALIDRGLRAQPVGDLFPLAKRRVTS